MRRSFIVASVVGCAIGVLIALDAGRKPGYVAAYSAVLALLLAGLAGLASLIMLIFRRSRKLGVAILLGASLGYVAFGGSMKVLESRGVWNEQMVPLAAARPDLLVVFKAGASRQSISEFVDNVISIPDSGRGHAQRRGVSGILLVHVAGHEGYAISFFPSATREQREDLRSRVEGLPIVCRIFDGVRPELLKVEQVACP